MLDVGCGNGQLLRGLHDAGWETYGVDFDQRALEASGLPATKARLGGATAALDFGVEFDAVVMRHVVEHLTDPVEDLRTIRRLVAPQEAASSS